MPTPLSIFTTAASANANMTCRQMALIERLEAATGPDRELDAEIIRTVFGCAVLQQPSGDGEYWINDRGRPGPSVPAYTSSLDAALTLVPEGCVGRIGFGGPGYIFAFATTPHDWNTKGADTIQATTPALALCIAALRARASIPVEV